MWYCTFPTLLDALHGILIDKMRLELFYPAPQLFYPALTRKVPGILKTSVTVVHGVSAVGLSLTNFDKILLRRNQLDKSG